MVIEARTEFDARRGMLAGEYLQGAMRTWYPYQTVLAGLVFGFRLGNDVIKVAAELMVA